MGAESSNCGINLMVVVHFISMGLFLSVRLTSGFFIIKTVLLLLMQHTMQHAIEAMKRSIPTAMRSHQYQKSALDPQEQQKGLVLARSKKQQQLSPLKQFTLTFPTVVEQVDIDIVPEIFFLKRI